MPEGAAAWGLHGSFIGFLCSAPRSHERAQRLRHALCGRHNQNTQHKTTFRTRSEKIKNRK